MRTVIAVLLLMLLSVHSTQALTAPYDESLNGATTSLATTLTQRNVTTVAVADFTNLKGEVSEVGRFVADEISSRLVERGRIRVIDRAALARLLRREGGTVADIDDPAVQDLVARTFNLTAVVKGTLMMVGGAFRLNIKIIDTASRTTIGAVLSEIPATESLTAMQGTPSPAANLAQPLSGTAPASRGVPATGAVRAKPVDVVVGRIGRLRLEVATVENAGCCTTLTLIATPVKPGVYGGRSSSAKVMLFNPKVSAYLVDARGEQKAFRNARGIPVTDRLELSRSPRTPDFEGLEIPFTVSVRFSLEFESKIDFTQKIDLAFKLLYTDSTSQVEEVVAVIRSIAFEQ